jgi:hypothetical protein
LELRGGRREYIIPDSTDARGGEDETCELGRGEDFLSGWGCLLSFGSFRLEKFFATWGIIRSIVVVYYTSDVIRK